MRCARELPASQQVKLRSPFTIGAKHAGVLLVASPSPLYDGIYYMRALLFYLRRETGEKNLIKCPVVVVPFFFLSLSFCFVVRHNNSKVQFLFPSHLIKSVCVSLQLSLHLMEERESGSSQQMLQEKQSRIIGREREGERERERERAARLRGLLYCPRVSDTMLLAYYRTATAAAVLRVAADAATAAADGR